MINFDIVTPHENSTIKVSWLEVTSPAGNFVIQKDHTNSIFTVLDGISITFCIHNGKPQMLDVLDGILSVKENKICLVAQKAFHI